jgi:hypothetical protein
VVLEVGEQVLFKGKVCTIVHVYQSGYVEIRESVFKVELVHWSELKPVNEK